MQRAKSMQNHIGTTLEPLSSKVVPDPSHTLKGCEGRNQLGQRTTAKTHAFHVKPPDDFAPRTGENDAFSQRLASHFAPEFGPRYGGAR